ncbi:MAG: extensin family protein [Pseudomonadota bacterium]|nr:extensin family protein [Pseudomonadota bacterium]
MRRLGAILLLALPMAARASAPDTSPRPQTRLETPAPAVQAIRPNPRPQSEQMAAMTRAGSLPVTGPDASARPGLRPPEVVEQALFKKRKLRKGAVCGDLDIQGEEAGPVPGRISGCGIKGAVRVTSVSGVRLSQPALINCPTAKALNKWVRKGVQPAFRKRVVELRVAAHYACRPRNNQSGAKISEHGRGNAIDISGFVLKSGEIVTVLNDWGRRALKKAHRAACGPFGTVLGPNSDRFHNDHFHLDTARHRGGPYCR